MGEGSRRRPRGTFWLDLLLQNGRAQLSHSRLRAGDAQNLGPRQADVSIRPAEERHLFWRLEPSAGRTQRTKWKPACFFQGSQSRQIRDLLTVPVKVTDPLGQGRAGQGRDCLLCLTVKGYTFPDKKVCGSQTPALFPCKDGEYQPQG